MTSVSLTVLGLKKIKDVAGLLTGGDIATPMNVSGIELHAPKLSQSEISEFYANGKNGRFTGENDNSDTIAVSVTTIAEMMKRIQLLEAKLIELGYL